MQTIHQYYMELALTLAAQGRLTVSPNPMVGCVIVKENRIIGRGFHQKTGEAHAEIHALNAAQESVSGATAYVSLEPCCHQNRTPPCTEALIKAGIKKVYVACLDPNPLVAGKGIKALEAAGIHVECGLYAKEAAQLNEIFFHYIRHHEPFVIAKWAMSLDGKTVTHPEDTRTISGAKSHEATHHTRQQVDAILIGANTAIQDDPLLTVRLQSELSPRHPVRIVLSSQGFLPTHLKMFAADMPGKTVIATTERMEKNHRAFFQKNNTDVLILPEDPSGRVHLKSLLKALGKMEISSLLVEGGRTVHESFFQENLVNKVHVYLAPTIIGHLNKKQPIHHLTSLTLDQDLQLIGNLKEPTCSLE